MVIREEVRRIYCGRELLGFVDRLDVGCDGVRNDL